MGGRRGPRGRRSCRADWGDSVRCRLSGSPASPLKITVWRTLKPRMAPVVSYLKVEALYPGLVAQHTAAGTAVRQPPPVLAPGRRSAGIQDVPDAAAVGGSASAAVEQVAGEGRAIQFSERDCKSSPKRVKGFCSMWGLA